MADRNPSDASKGIVLRLERRGQVRGSPPFPEAVLLFAVSRVGLHMVFTPGWWRLW